MARVSISWDGQAPIEYEGSHAAMQEVARGISHCVRMGWLALCIKGAGDLQYTTGPGWPLTDSVCRYGDDQGDQLELEDAIKEVKDNGC